MHLFINHAAHIFDTRRDDVVHHIYKLIEMCAVSKWFFIYAVNIELLKND